MLWIATIFERGNSGYAFILSRALALTTFICSNLKFWRALGGGGGSGLCSRGRSDVAHPTVLCSLSSFLVSPRTAFPSTFHNKYPFKNTNGLSILSTRLNWFNFAWIWKTNNPSERRQRLAMTMALWRDGNGH